MSFTRRLAAIGSPCLEKYRPLLVDGVRLGWIDPRRADFLLAGGEVLRADAHEARFASHLDTPEKRTAALAARLTRHHDRIPGWRNELYPANTRFGEKPAFLIERAAAALLGLRAYGVNLVGYCKDGAEYSFWLARRAAHKHLAPLAWDTMVGGGQPHDLSLEENLRKEAWEEAGLDSTMLVNASRAGEIAFAEETPAGLRREWQANYELLMPKDVAPQNRDGEVAEFRLVDRRELLALLESDAPFLIDAVLVFADFFLRHRLLDPAQAVEVRAWMEKLRFSEAI
jgi:8-oxo-dGTP pyrophosphatase MutT (NUDIX family)